MQRQNILGVYKAAKIKPSLQKVRKQQRITLTKTDRQEKNRRQLSNRKTISFRGTEKQN